MLCWGPLLKVFQPEAAAELFYLDHLLCDLSGLVNIQHDLGIAHHRIKRPAFTQAEGREGKRKSTGIKGLCGLMWLTNTWIRWILLIKIQWLTIVIYCWSNLLNICVMISHIYHSLPKVTVSLVKQCEKNVILCSNKWSLVVLLFCLLTPTMHFNDFNPVMGQSCHTLHCTLTSL